MNDGWISVKERLPKPGERVLGVNSVSGIYDPFTTYYSDGFKCFIVYKNDNNGDGDYGVTADVTHWMLLPKPPQQ